MSSFNGLRVYAEINLDALIYNLDTIHKSLNPGTGVCCVVKSDAYGHGAVEVAKAVTGLPYVRYLAVATPEEGMELRKSGIECPILILSPVFPASASIVVEYDLTPSVFTGEQLDMFAGLSGEAGREIRIHVPVDTGMSRIGVFPDEEGLSFIRSASCVPGLRLEGVFTHLSRADEDEPLFSSGSVRQFQDFCRKVKASGIEVPICHCSNSAAVHTIKSANMDMVRVGITMYGLSPSNEVTREGMSLKPVMGLHSGISFIKEIRPGTPVSYGGTFVAERPMRIATVGAGYADGYPRSLSNKGYVVIREKTARILGRVCMDQFMVDVTDIPEAAVYDDVLLFGDHPDIALSAEDVDELSSRFNYELTSLISSRVPRIFIRNGRPFAASDRFGRREL